MSPAGCQSSTTSSRPASLCQDDPG